MRHLFSLILFHQHNIHILHWKTCGRGFGFAHKEADAIYAQTVADLDAVGEIMMQYETNPVSYKEMLDILINDEHEHVSVNPTLNYAGDETYILMQKICDDICTDIQRVLDTEKLMGCHKSKLEDLQSFYSLQAKYLIKQRLVK